MVQQSMASRAVNAAVGGLRRRIKNLALDGLSGLFPPARSQGSRSKGAGKTRVSILARTTKPTRDVQVLGMDVRDASQASFPTWPIVEEPAIKGSTTRQLGVQRTNLGPAREIDIAGIRWKTADAGRWIDGYSRGCVNDAPGGILLGDPAQLFLEEARRQRQPPVAPIRHALGSCGRRRTIVFLTQPGRRRGHGDE